MQILNKYLKLNQLLGEDVKALHLGSEWGWEKTDSLKKNKEYVVHCEE